MGDELDLILPPRDSLDTKNDVIILTDFDQFSEDSIEREKNAADNLEDSL